MSVINKLIPLLEIDLGTRKLFYSSQAMKIRDGNNFKQYDARLKNEGGILRSFSISDFKSSISVASNVGIINDQKLQDIFANNPESFTSVKLTYISSNDTTSKIDELQGVASNPNWDQFVFNMNIKDSQKLYFQNVPTVIFDERTFQTSFILIDSTAYTRTLAVGDPAKPGTASTPGGTKNVTLIKNLVSSSFGGRANNYWKGSRIDVIMDQRAWDDTNNTIGQFAVVSWSNDTTVFFNDVLDKFLVREDETSQAVLNNTMMTDLGTYDTTNLTFQCYRNALPQNSDTVGNAVPILYGAPERVPMVWAQGQKSTKTNSFGVGDDVYLFASHKCKLGIMPDSTTALGLTATNANNNVYTYSPDNASYPGKDQLEVSDGLRVEVYWSLEDKRVVDGKIAPNTKGWIPNPFPKRWRNSGSNASNSYQDHPMRLISPLMRIKTLTTLRGELVQAVQLRGGEFDWFDLGLTSPKLEQRAQYPIRYGMGNSKLYISVEGYEDDQDGFYTGQYKSQLSLGAGLGPENLENIKQSTLIKNPADIMLHFLMKYSSINEDRNLVNLESFRKSRQMLDSWRFDTAIMEVIGGEELIDRWCQQCCSIVFMDSGKFKMKTIIPSQMTPKAYLREGEHMVKQKFEFTKTEDIYNMFNFAYKYDYVHNKYSSVLIRNKKNNSLCRKSVAINGFERAKPTIEFRDIQDENTANILADIYIDFLSKRRITLDTDLIYNQEVIDSNIEIGDCVAVTTSQAPNGWIEKPCIVLETRKYTDHCEAKLLEI